MIKTITLFFCLAISVVTKSQTTAADFTVTDINGNTYNLYTILNSGKYVFIDFFYTTCEPCQEKSPIFKQHFYEYGCNSQEVFFISIDWKDNNADVLEFENTYLGGPSNLPAISGIEGGGKAVVESCDLIGFPRFMLIAPNKQIVELAMRNNEIEPIFENHENVIDIVGYDTLSFKKTLAKYNLQPKACLTAGITENFHTKTSLYPNPATNELTIAYETPSNITKYELTNQLGQVLYTTKAVTEKNTISLNNLNLTNGIYFVKTYTYNNQYSISKFVKG